ncbi:MAG: hypothetical protein JWQ95_4625 [Sphaerisporangium sp.]|jgi:hypothetical protein|nr:hypothetical protein [Sphaerisporangium sp.]
MDPYHERLSVRDPYRVAGLWARVALLVVLLWGGLVTALSMNPPNHPVEDFRAALRAGEVTYVLESGTGRLDDLRWSSGPLLWYRAEVLTYHTGKSYKDYDRNTFGRDLDAARRYPIVRPAPSRHGGNGLFPDWPFRVPVPHADWLVPAAWIATLLIMLSTARPRLGNRWAWFWLFTVGQVGAILYLMLEPRPVWRGLDPQVSGSSWMGGGQGCLASIALGVLSPFAALAVSSAVNGLILVTTGH